MGITKNIWQIVGFSNSGKTTLVEKLLQFAESQHKRVATIKHHGHGKKLTALDTGKDSWRHRQAGAIGCAVVAEQTLQLQVTKQVTWQVSDLLDFYGKLDLDAILIEGYKFEEYKKVVVIRTKEHLNLLKEVSNIQAVVVWDGIEIGETEDYTLFNINDAEEIGRWLVKQWEEGKDV